MSWKAKVTKDRRSRLSPRRPELTSCLNSPIRVDFGPNAPDVFPKPGGPRSGLSWGLSPGLPDGGAELCQLRQITTCQLWKTVSSGPYNYSQVILIWINRPEQLNPDTTAPTLTPKPSPTYFYLNLTKYHQCFLSKLMYRNRAHGKLGHLGRTPTEPVKTLVCDELEWGGVVRYWVDYGHQVHYFCVFAAWSHQMANE